MTPLTLSRRQETLRFSEVECSAPEVALASARDGVAIAVTSGPKQCFKIWREDDDDPGMINTPLIPAGESYVWQPAAAGSYVIQSKIYPSLRATITVGPTAGNGAYPASPSAAGAVDDRLSLPLARPTPSSSRPGLLGVSSATRVSPSPPTASLGITASPSPGAFRLPSPNGSTGSGAARFEGDELEQHPSLPGLRRRRGDSGSSGAVPGPAPRRRTLAALRPGAYCLDEILASDDDEGEEESESDGVYSPPPSMYANRDAHHRSQQQAYYHSSRQSTGSGSSGYDDHEMMKLVDTSARQQGALRRREASPPTPPRQTAPPRHRCHRCAKDYLSPANAARCEAAHVAASKQPRGGAPAPAAVTTNQLAAYWDGLDAAQRAAIFDLSADPEASRALHHLAAAPSSPSPHDALSVGQLFTTGVVLAALVKDTARLARLKGAQLVLNLERATEKTLLMPGAAAAVAVAAGAKAPVVGTGRAAEEFLASTGVLGGALGNALLRVRSRDLEERAAAAVVALEAELHAEQEAAAAAAATAAAKKKKGKKKKGKGAAGPAVNPGETALTADAIAGEDKKEEASSRPAVSDSCMEEVVLEAAVPPPEVEDSAAEPAAIEVVAAPVAVAEEEAEEQLTDEPEPLELPRRREPEPVKKAPPRQRPAPEPPQRRERPATEAPRQRPEPEAPQARQQPRVVPVVMQRQQPKKQQQQQRANGRPVAAAVQAAPAGPVPVPVAPKASAPLPMAPLRAPELTSPAQLPVPPPTELPDAGPTPPPPTALAPSPPPHILPPHAPGAFYPPVGHGGFYPPLPYAGANGYVPYAPGPYIPHAPHAPPPYMGHVPPQMAPLPPVTGAMAPIPLPGSSAEVPFHFPGYVTMPPPPPGMPVPDGAFTFGDKSGPKAILVPESVFYGAAQLMGPAEALEAEGSTASVTNGEAAAEEVVVEEVDEVEVEQQQQQQQQAPQPCRDDEFDEEKAMAFFARRTAELLGPEPAPPAEAVEAPLEEAAVASLPATRRAPQVVLSRTASSSDAVSVGAAGSGSGTSSRSGSPGGGRRRGRGPGGHRRSRHAPPLDQQPSSFGPGASDTPQSVDGAQEGHQRRGGSGRGRRRGPPPAKAGAPAGKGPAAGPPTAAPTGGEWRIQASCG